MSTWFLKKLETEGLHSIQCIMHHIAAKSYPDTIKMSRFFKKEKLKNKDTCNVSSAFMYFHLSISLAIVKMETSIEQPHLGDMDFNFEKNNSKHREPSIYHWAKATNKWSSRTNSLHEYITYLD